MTPQAMPEAPAPTPVLSSTRASSPASARCQGLDSPWPPAPTIRCRAESGRAAIGLVVGRLPALEHRPLPVGPHGLRVLHSGAELRLWELGVGFLQPDAVRVAPRQVRHQ